MDAKEAKRVGLATDVFPQETFHLNVQQKLEEYAKFDTVALQRIKKILRSHDTDMLHLVNDRECQHLANVWQSKECAEALAKVTAKLKNK